MRNKRNILVVIAARGGSKGVKNKNIRMLAGKPLIAYTILQARKWGRAQNIICSTDSEDIASVAKKYGAETPFERPSYLAGDRVPKVRVIKHALKEAEKFYKKEYEIVIDLDVTSPIRKISDLNHCLELFFKHKPKTLFSVVRARRNPYYNMVETKNNGKAVLCKILRKTVNARQEAPLVYDANASIYFYSRNYLVNGKNLKVVTDNSLIYIMDDISGVDIDSELDFKFIEFLMKEGVYKSEI